MKINIGCGALMVHWIVSALLIMLCAWIIPGVGINGFGSALWIYIIFGLLNAFIKPAMLLLTFPITLITFGLFVIIINTLFIWIASEMINSFYIEGFWSALWFGLLYSLFKIIIFKINKDNKNK